MPKRRIVDVRNFEPLDMDYDWEIPGCPDAINYPTSQDPATLPREVEQRVASDFERGLAQISA